MLWKKSKEVTVDDKMDTLQKVLDHICTSQKFLIIRLKDHCMTLSSEADELLHKIESKQDMGHYSSHHSALQRATELSRICNELSHLRSWRETIEKSLKE